MRADSTAGPRLRQRMGKGNPDELATAGISDSADGGTYGRRAFIRDGVGIVASRRRRSAPRFCAATQQQRPNVLIWLMDDVGFGQLSSFGGLVDTPNIDRVARMGVS